MMRMTMWFAAGILLSVAACGGTGETISDDVPGTLEDLGTSDVATLEVTLELQSWEIAKDGGPTLPDLKPVDYTVDVEPPCEEGCFLSPCESGADCQSGWCVQHMGNDVCTLTCLDECPMGWECQQVGTGPDVGWICVSPFTHLCRPCTDGNDCESPTGVEDACLDFGPAGRFCGANCQEDNECPDGFLCQAALTEAAVEVVQCMPESGICECSDKAVALGLDTVCFVENEVGVCWGQRVCAAEGLTDCDAVAAEVEVCDGLDNNCDGDIDEDTCDDGNDCTMDQCLGTDGCASDPLTGDECKDENPCTVADHCEEGECMGSPVLCNDSNPCTADACDETGGCVFEANFDACDDGDPCTVGDQCKDESCVGTHVPCDCKQDSDCEGLEDGDVCNGTLVCDKTQVPYVCTVDSATLVACPEPEGMDAICLMATCDAVTGQCGFTPDHEGFVCDDEDACILGETCAAGACQGGVAPSCADDNPCTDDSCDISQGCLHQPNQLPCSDLDVCTVGDTCDAGACAPGGEFLVCDDVNPCTDDSCDPTSGCQHTANLLPCDDGSACTLNDACSGGSCSGGQLEDCDDSNPCTTEYCDPAQGCVIAMNQLPCNDGNPCTTKDLCEMGECAGTAVVCNDSNGCTDDACDPQSGGCTFTPNQAPCDDNDLCTETQQCQDGACKPQTFLDCNDDNPCTADVCDSAQGCVYTFNEAPCTDGDACTTSDFCQMGECMGVLLACDDLNPCTDDTCDVNDGCVFAPNQKSCDDNNKCTIDDKCNDGVCTATQMKVCDDGNPCTTQTCDSQEGCVSQFNQAFCDDGDVCTSNDQCDQGECQGQLINCSDSNLCTDDECAPGVGCVHTNNNVACADGNLCTDDDQCTNGQCVGQSMVNCADGDPCTLDSCLPLLGCVNDLQPVCCGDGVCSPGEGCSCPAECAVAETCDGEDNDCNDVADDGLGTTTCGLGVCQHTVDNCVGGQSQLCDPFEGKKDEVCENNLDDDCDGGVDEAEDCPTDDLCSQGSNVLVNGGFESGSVSPWYSDCCYAIVNDAHDGSFAIKSTGNHWLRQDFAPVAVSAVKEIGFWTKKGAASMPMAVEFQYSDGSKNQECCFYTGTSWKYWDLKSYLQGGKSLNGLKIWGYSGGGGNQNWVDSARVCK
jgi:hypothetical protein